MASRRPAPANQAEAWGSFPIRFRAKLRERPAMAKKPSTATPMDQLPTSGHAGLGGGGEYFGGGGGGSWGLGSAIAVTPAKAQAVTMATSAKLNVRVIPAVFLFMCIPSCFCGISSGSESLPPGIARKKFRLEPRIARMSEDAWRVLVAESRRDLRFIVQPSSPGVGSGVSYSNCLRKAANSSRSWRRSSLRPATSLSRASSLDSGITLGTGSKLWEDGES